MASSESVQKRCAQARHFRFHVKPPILVSTSELYILRHNKPPDPTRSAPLPAMCDDCNTQNLHRNRMPAAASEAIAVVTRSRANALQGSVLTVEAAKSSQGRGSRFPYVKNLP